LKQIESLLGFALPTPARTEREWWADIVDPQLQWAAWIEAGRTAAPNLAAEIITFERPSRQHGARYGRPLIDDEGRTAMSTISAD
jgi:hypothetical protein